MKGQANPAANSGANPGANPGVNPGANPGANPEAWVHRGHWLTGCRLRAATPPLWEQTSEAWGSKNKLDPEDGGDGENGDGGENGDHDCEESKV